MTTLSNRRQVAHRQTNDGEHLLALLRRVTADPRNAEVSEPVAWLARTLGAQVALIAPSGEVLASSSRAARTMVARAAEQARRVAAGLVSSAAVDVDGVQVRMTPVGGTAPRAVLAVRLPGNWSSWASRLLGHTAVGINVLTASKAIEAEKQRQRAVARDQADAVFHLLMGGMPTLARRAGARVVPNVLTADHVRVCIINCGTDRTAWETLTAIEQTLSSNVLAGVCASIPRNLNVVLPVSAAGARTRTALEKVVTEREDHCMGVSAPMPQDAVPLAYREATHALAVALHRPGRVAEIDAQHSVTTVLNTQLLRQWSEWHLRPLNERPQGEREKLLNTLRIFLEFPQRAETARALGVQRNTVRDRITRASRLLDLDLDDVRARARLYLALECDTRYGLEPAPAVPPDLDDLYDGNAARSWAAARLAPLKDDLRDTLRTWINDGGDYRRAAPRLGLTEAGLRARINRASHALELDLHSGSSGAYELAAALEIIKPTPHPASQAA